MTAVAPVPPYLAPGRALRLDFFRGLALWFIFLDHVPDNIVSWLTVRNYGFSDATEIFVYISGYTAVIAYSRMMARDVVLDLRRGAVWKRHDAPGERDSDDQSGEQQHQGDHRERRQWRACLRPPPNRSIRVH